MCIKSQLERVPMPDQGWVNFGQKERLTVRLKDLIRNYPRGVGIIKEFIQKADDAGAKSLSLLLDSSIHIIGVQDKLRRRFRSHPLKPTRTRG
jgi:hypothetical protein